MSTNSIFSASATTNSAFARPAASACRVASAIASASRSMPTTRRTSGASASAMRPRPVPTSSTVAPASGSEVTSRQNVGLTPGGAATAISELRSAGDGALRSARHQARVLGHDARDVARLGPLDRLEALLELGRRELHVEPALLDVDDDRVAGLQRGDGSAVGGLGRHVTDHEAVGGAGEAAVGHERDLVAEAGALDGAGHVQHLAHARAALGAFPADDDDVVRLDLAGLHGGERVLLAIEHARGAAMRVTLLAGDLRHAAVGRQVAAQDHHPALGLDRLAQRAHDLLAGRLA